MEQPKGQRAAAACLNVCTQNMDTDFGDARPTERVPLETGEHRQPLPAGNGESAGIEPITPMLQSA